MEAVFYYVSGKTLYQLHRHDIFYWLWIHGSIYMTHTHVLDCMAKAPDKMDADVSIWRDKILLGEMCYFMVMSGG